MEVIIKQSKVNFMVWRVMPLIIFIVLVIFFVYSLKSTQETQTYILENKPLPNFKLPFLEPEKQRAQLFTPKILHGQIALLNVWASWCLSCEEEHIFLMQLAHQGVAIYGINYKDDLQSAKKWLTELGNPYKAIGWDAYGAAGIDLGVYKTPESFIIDETGKIRAHYIGPLDENAWLKLSAALNKIGLNLEKINYN